MTNILNIRLAVALDFQQVSRHYHKQLVEKDVSFLIEFTWRRVASIFHIL